MSEYTSFPLSWPLSWKRTKSPQRSRFGSYYKKPTVAQGRDSVIDELRKMRVPDYQVAISTNVALRRDGLPYSNQKEPNDTGVAVYFKINGKPTVLACDKWNTVGNNLWAIAKHIEALRGQDRWGVGSIEQAFAGYAALEEKTQASCWEVLEIPPQNHDLTDARRFPQEQAEQIIMDPGRLPQEPNRNWWAGKVVTCLRCKGQFELESSDTPRDERMLQLSNGREAYFGCPTKIRYVEPGSNIIDASKPSWVCGGIIYSKTD